jgi:formamidopyrimidine-DNA glycosylase
MPELAEVVYFAKQWDGGIGHAITDLHVHQACRVFRKGDVEALVEGLPGAKLKDSRTHGKQMLFEFTGGKWLNIHLGMTGELSAQPPGYQPAKHDHLVLMTKAVSLVFTDSRQFGAVTFAKNDGPPAEWLKLPPQPMDRGFTEERLATPLQRHGKVMLKSLLLDQRYFPGIGNWMADEVMWQMKLPPHILAGKMNPDQVKALRKTLIQVCEGAIKTIGVNWGDPPKSWLFHYRWGKGQKCPRCGGDLVREEVRGRTACWCPVCQKEREGD